MRAQETGMKLGLETGDEPGESNAEIETGDESADGPAGAGRLPEQGVASPGVDDIGVVRERGRGRTKLNIVGGLRVALGVAESSRRTPRRQFRETAPPGNGRGRASRRTQATQHSRNAREARSETRKPLPRRSDVRRAKQGGVGQGRRSRRERRDAGPTRESRGQTGNYVGLNRETTENEGTMIEADEIPYRKVVFVGALVLVVTLSVFTLASALTETPPAESLERVDGLDQQPNDRSDAAPDGPAGTGHSGPTQREADSGALPVRASRETGFPAVTAFSAASVGDAVGSASARSVESAGVLGRPGTAESTNRESSGRLTDENNGDGEVVALEHPETIAPGDSFELAVETRNSSQTTVTVDLDGPVELTLWSEDAAQIDENRVVFTDSTAGNSTHLVDVNVIGGADGDVGEIVAWVNAENRAAAEDDKTSSFTFEQADAIEEGERVISDETPDPGETVDIEIRATLGDVPDNDFLLVTEQFTPAFEDTAYHGMSVNGERVSPGFVIATDDSLVVDSGEVQLSDTDDVTIAYEATVAEEGTEYELTGSVGFESETLDLATETITVTNETAEITAAERTAEASELRPGESTAVTLNVSLDKQGDISVEEAFDPAFTTVEIVDADGADYARPTDGNDGLVASWTDVTDVTLVYEVTMPADATDGATFTLSSSNASDIPTDATPAITLEAVDDAIEIAEADRFVEKTELAPGESTRVTLDAQLEKEGDLSVREAFEPSFETVEIVDDADADFIEVTDANDELLASYTAVSEVSLVYEVTVPESAEQGETFTLTASNTSDLTAEDTPDVTVEVHEPSVSEYTDGDGQVQLQGVREAILDWRGEEIGLNLLTEVIDAWRTDAVLG